MRILVVGGTGLIGSKLVGRLRRDGHNVLAASPSSGVNTVTGEGLPEAMEGAEVVIDVTNPPSDSSAAWDFFLRSGNNISAVETAARVSHHVALSLVGLDRLRDREYFRAKLLQEALIRQAGIPYTIVRSTQFFEFLPHLADFGSDGRIVRLSPTLVQPAAANDVADTLAHTALQPTANRVVELAGPEPLRLSDAVGRVLAANQDERSVSADPDARYFGVRLGERTLMPAGNAHIAPTRFTEWLDATNRASTANT